MATILANVSKTINDLLDIVYTGIDMIYSSLEFLPNEIKYTFLTVLTIAVAVFIYKLIR